MKKTLLLILSAACIASASQSGAEIFKKCGICHGDQGQRHSQNLTKYIAAMEEESLVKILKAYRSKTRDEYGLGTMMQGQAAKLSDDDIVAVAKHISSLPPVKIDPAATAKPVSKEMDGAEIFKKCAICHGDKGQKRSLNVSKHIAGMDKDHIYKVLKAYQAGELSTYGYGNMMKGQATKLSDDEMKKVAEYVFSLPVVKEDTKKTKQTVKKISKEEMGRNAFIRDFFAKSKNPNETLKAAEAAYQEYKNNLKENNE